MANIFFYNHIRPFLTFDDKPSIYIEILKNNSNQEDFLKTIEELLDWKR